MCKHGWVAKEIWETKQAHVLGTDLGKPSRTWYRTRRCECIRAVTKKWSLPHFSGGLVGDTAIFCIASMEETLQALQEALLLQEDARLPSSDALPEAVLASARQLQQAQYVALLSTDEARALLAGKEAPELPATAVEQLPVLFTGIACLQLFFQLNWTGPDVPLADLVPLYACLPYPTPSAPTRTPTHPHVHTLQL